LPALHPLLLPLPALLRWYLISAADLVRLTRRRHWLLQLLRMRQLRLRQLLLLLLLLRAGWLA
jgi:hypothetical protein